MFVSVSIGGPLEWPRLNAEIHLGEIQRVFTLQTQLESLSSATAETPPGSFVGGFQVVLVHFFSLYLSA